jgi:serine/threonine protein kinase
MTISTDEFWGLLEASMLVSSARIPELRAEFAGFGGASTKANATTIAEWLVSTSVIQPFHRTALLEGNRGPFVFADYLLMDRLSQPAMKGWFRVQHRASGHPALLQFLSGDAVQDPACWDRMVASVQQHAALTDRILQQVYEPLDLGNYRLVVYEDVTGPSLRERISSGGAIDFEAACQITWTIAHALSRLHQQGLVHGSLSPDSIILPATGGCRLLRNLWPTKNPLDLHARPQDPEWLRISDYLAPELGQVQQATSPTADVYALGSCFYEMLRGQPPFPGGGLIEKLQRHAATPFPSLGNPRIPATVDRLLAYLVNKDPARRYAQAGELPDKIQLLLPDVALQLPPIAIPASEAGYRTAISQQQQSAGEQEIASITGSPAPRSFQGIQAVAVKPDRPREDANEERLVETRPRRRKRRRLEKSPVFWGTLGAAALGIILLLAFNLPTNNQDKQDGGDKTADTGDGGQDTGDVPPPRTNGDVPLPKNSGGTGAPPLAEDDGSLLWESPTGGNPVQLNWLPPGAQLIVAARPSDLFAHGGEDALRALGPAFGSKQAAWEKATGIKLSAVKQIVIGLYDNDERFPRPAFVVELDEPMTRDQLLESFGDPQSVQVENGPFYYKGQQYAFVIPEEEGRTRFVMGHEDDILEVLKFPGKAPPIAPNLGRLLKLSDENRHFTMIFVPTFLTNNIFRDGRDLQIGEPRRIRDALEWILDDSIGGGMVSMHMDTVFYLEARLYAGLSRNQFQLATTFKDRMSEVPEKITDYIVLLNPHLHWRRIAFQYPHMIRYLHDQTRVGVDGDIAIINAALPTPAAANLLLGAELCLVAEPTTQITGNNDNPPAKYDSIQDVLKISMSVDIPQQDLNLAVVDIENQVRDQIGEVSFPFLIKILGDDLKLDGITRNQAIRDFKVTGKPLAELLTGLVMKANPDPTVKDPSEEKQKLIWVLGPDPTAPENTIILITTRAAAKDAARKYEISVAFKSK